MNQSFDSENSLASAVSELNTYNQKRSRSFCDTYIFEPESPREAPCGKLFVMIEIEENSKKASQVAEAIATIAQFEYYKNQHPGIVANFEAALAKVNEILSEIAEHGEISWVGKIHAVIAANAGHHLAVSQTGRVKTLLIRNGLPMEIGEESTRPSTSVVRTFDSIATGDLLPHDHLVFTNSTLLNSLSVSRIESFLAQNPVLASARLAQNTLDKTAQEPACALLIKIDTAKAIAIENSKDERYADLTPEELSQEPPVKKLRNAYDDIRSRTWAVKVLSGVKAAGRGVKVAGMFVAHFFQNIVEGIRGKAESRKTNEPKTLTNLEQENEAASEQPRIIISSQDAPIRMIEVEERFPTSRTTKGNRSLQNEDDLFNDLPKKKGFSIVAIWSSAFTKVKNLPRTMKKMPRVSQVLLATSASLLIIFVVGIGIFSTNKAEQAKAAQFKSTLDEATAKYNSAVASLIYKNTTQANGLLKEAESLNGQVLGSKYFNADAAALQDKINQEKERVLHINDVQGITKLATLPDASATTVAMITNGTSLLVAGTNNKVYSVGMKNGATAEVVKRFGGTGNITKLNYFEAQDDFLMLTDKSSVHQYITKAGVIEDFNTLDFGDITDITSYGTRYIYFLKPSENKIVRVTRTTAGLATQVSWIKESSANIQKAISLAIDGSIYVLGSDGVIQKFLNGTHDDFTMPTLKTPLSKPTKIVTNENLKNLYVLDPENKRIVILKKTGAFVKELTAENFSTLKDIVVDEAKSVVYAASGSAVYTFPLALN